MMSITPDLRPDEFELTVTCPIGPCFVQYTCAYSREVLKQNASFRTQVKQNMMTDVKKQHEDGRHKMSKEQK